MIVFAFLVAAAAPFPDSAETRLLHAQFGQCVVKQRAAAAAKYVLDVETDDSDARQMHRDLPLVSCLERLAPSSSARLTLPADTLRYTLADALVRVQYRAPKGDFSAVPPLPRAVWNEENFKPAPGKKASARELAELATRRSHNVEAFRVAEFGECIVRANPTASHALLMTDVASIEERTRIAALGTEFTTCLKPGETLAFGNLVLRGGIALNYYRLAKSTTGRGGAE